MNKLKKVLYALCGFLALGLGIIGIVSALTLPSVINHFKLKQLESAFKPADTLIQQAIQKSVDENIEIEDIVKIATSKKGLKKDVNCKYKVVINKVDSEKYLGKCKKIADLCQNFDINVIFTSYKNI